MIADYILSPDFRYLLKAGKNWRENTTYTDDKGRRWLFNEKTRRWGLHPDFKLKPKKRDRNVDAEWKETFKPEVDAEWKQNFEAEWQESTTDKTTDPLNSLNNIVPFNVKRRSEFERVIDKIKDVLKGRSLESEFTGAIARYSIVAKLNDMYRGKISRESAQIAAMNKRIFETLHPRKLVRVPKGTSQVEYANICWKLAAGDKDAIKQYTVRRPAKKRGKGRKMSKAIAYGGHLYHWDGRQLVKVAQAGEDWPFDFPRDEAMKIVDEVFHGLDS